ncbi:Apolipoprotein N-acyltransferase / Copper homeostasis protein CutE [hydrothermal vent metagenome]|uniref:Apolipoprotein N-acyltransferase / Copper homeostasis protein CutE n=1 Tax=hydrothermal vent metagenome TaxID=652676 RepID=A0A3B0WPR7_9ZZZZ
MLMPYPLEKKPYHLLEIIAFVCGLLLPFSFAPYGLFWLQFPLLAYLFLICLEQSPAIAFRRGFFFGLGWFVHGIHWLFYSLHFHGGMPAPIAVLTIVLLSAVLALFPAFSMYLINRHIKTSPLLMLVLVYPTGWVIFEWLRGYILTGFPWVQTGIAHIDTPLAGFAPLTGSLGVGLAAAIIAGLLAVSLLKIDAKSVFYKISLPLVMGIYASGFLLGFVQWTQPVGKPIKASLMQGNIAQAEKWKRANRWPTMQMYRELTQKNWQSDLIVWPETALPGFRKGMSAYLKELRVEAEKNSTDVLLGVFVRNQQTRRYYNSVITLDEQLYKKRHLVPLGEYFPFRPLLGFFSQWVNIPMSDIENGEAEQPLIKAAGQVIGVSICFEDAFDRDILRDLPEATMLVNVSNDAWFEDSPEPWQHHQIARMRALETGRTLLRATNTGVSSVIGPKGNVLAMSAQFKREVLTLDVQGYEGGTPYVLWGNYLLISFAAVFLLVLGFKKSVSTEKAS